MAEQNRPILTMPEAEAEALADAFGQASVVLEYGSGGSTLMAAEMGKTVFSVESDRVWMEGIAQWFEAHPPKGRVILHHGDIGPTGKWGVPANMRMFRRFPSYALSVWRREDFQHPDVVLIDGRFRPSCLLATAFQITRPVTVLFDDYAERDAYHGVEEMFRPVAMHGRMARFQLEPTAIPVDRLEWVFGWFLRHQ